MSKIVKIIIGVVVWIFSGIVFPKAQGYLLMGFLAYLIYYFYKKHSKNSVKVDKSSEIKESPFSLNFEVSGDNLTLHNPFRGIFVIGAAGSGKTESVAIPALEQFIKKEFSGVIYDFKYPTLANEVETLLHANPSRLKHYHVSFDTNYATDKINPIDPKYLPNTSYAREYAQSIISNLMKESIKKPDYWSRSATDILTACIWFLREEHPDLCDIPHLFALITSNDEKLIKLLQSNINTQQMTISLFSAMEKGAHAQVAGVIGTLQGSIAQINTPELMHVFSANEVPLQLNDPENPIILTVGNNPTLSTTLAPLCSLIITVCTKLMNQPNKHQSFVLLDEAPTVFIPNLEVIPNTGRSNKISTIIMCQDLSQLTDGYGKDKADVLFSACNNHFYGRVSTSQTAELLSKQFGKQNVTFNTSSQNLSPGVFGKQLNSTGTSQSIQEREIIKASEFLDFSVGYFTGIVVESNKNKFKGYFKAINRGEQKTLPTSTENIDYMKYYRKVREDINKIFEQETPGTNNIKEEPIFESATDPTFELDEEEFK